MTLIVENDRLAELAHFQPRDIASSAALDRLTRLVADLFDAPIALVSLIDADHQWLKSRCGLAVASTPREHSFCAHVLPQGRGGVLVVTDASQDARFADNPLVTGEPGIRFYLGAALTSHAGLTLGALCVIDTKPRPAPDARTIERLRDLAEVVVDHLEQARTERRQREQQHLLQMAESVSGVGHWRLDLDAKKVAWSREVYRIHGVSPEDFDPNLDSAVDFYHPDDQSKVLATLDAAIASMEPVGFQLRLRRHDGKLRTVVSRALCQRDSSGAPTAIFGVFQDITEHTQALTTAQRNEARYRLLADNMADVVTRIRSDGSSNYISPAVERLLGYRPEEMVGRPAHDFVHPDDRPDVIETFAALSNREGRRTLEVRAVKKDGTYRWVETSFQSLARGDGKFEIVAVIRDITERRGLEAAAAERERLYRLLADNSTDLIDRSSVDCDILYVSPAARQLTGYDPDELIGRKTTDFIHPEDWPHVQRAYAKLVHFGHEARAEPITYRMIRKDGTHVWVEVSPKLIWDGDRPVEFVDVVRNVTERKAVEAELVEARRAAEAAADAKAQFLANMSHELRTPLTSILGFSRLLGEQPELSGFSSQCLQRLDVASQALLSTVNDILDFSKLEAGQVVIKPLATDIRSFCTGTLELLAPQAAAKQLVMHAEFGNDVPAALAIDPDRVRQILLNLVGNAVKFTAAGCVLLSISYNTERYQLGIAVIDTGPGIAAAQLAVLFQRFSQVDGGNARVSGGTGLGLAICKGLAEAMGGRVDASSTVGVGSCFRCTIDAEPANLLPADQLPGEMSSLHGLRVLVADDNAANQELVALVLKSSGCEIVAARDGIEALNIASQSPLDVMLFDINMPGLNGLETLKSVRRGGGPNDLTPALAFTADGEAKSSSLIAAGFAGIVTKPFQPAQLINALINATEIRIYDHAC